MALGKINIAAALKNVEELLREDKTISPQVRAMFELLVIVINLLMAKLGLNSKNSSIPPSKDPRRKRGSTRKVKGEKRQPGGQPGHKGQTLRMDDNPDEMQTLEIDRRTLPAGEYTRVGFDVRQVIDIEISKKVTEYRAEILRNAATGEQFVASFPLGVTRSIQYGSHLKAHAVYMSQQQLLPYERIRDYFADQCDIPLSAGTLVNFNQEAFELLVSFEQIAKKQLILQNLLHADETGINMNGKNFWLHSVSNDLWTLFFPHEKRGADAMKAMGILEHFQGILCHDHWKPYFLFACKHALCNAHHLRELERAWEQDGQKWARKMQDLLVEINEATIKAGGCLTEDEAAAYGERYRGILSEGDRECPPPEESKCHGKRGRIARSKARNLLERLRHFEIETLRFMTDPFVPFTNNQGENDIRMTKVQQKISGCFRSVDGARIFCRVRSYLSTCRKHGIAATEALELLFVGKLPEFLVKLE